MRKKLPLPRYASPLETLSELRRHLEWVDERARDMQESYLRNKLRDIADALKDLAKRIKP